MEERYFRVTAKCGHVRRSKFILIDFAVVAESAAQAAEKVKWFPRVKHQHKDVIHNVVELTYNEFYYLRSLNKSDKYLQCKNIQKQNNIENLYERIFDEECPAEKTTHFPFFKIKKNQLEEIDSINKLNEYYADAFCL